LGNIKDFWGYYQILRNFLIAVNDNGNQDIFKIFGFFVAARPSIIPSYHGTRNFQGISMEKI
jgi:uncharacterized protein (UPF0297 family)